MEAARRGVGRWVVRMGYEGRGMGKVDYCFYLGLMLG